MGTSTFSQYTVVADVSVVAVNPAAPLEKVCLLGCGITTAWGAVVKQQGIKDSTVAVFGCGCIGLGVINASTLVGASRIIAIDTNSGKEAWAKKFGATEFVNPTQLPAGKRIQDYLVEITDGGLDFTFDATGNVSPKFIGYFSDTEVGRVRSTLCVLPSRPAIRDGGSRLSLVSPLQERRSPLVRKLHRSSTPICSRLTPSVVQIPIGHGKDVARDSLRWRERTDRNPGSRRRSVRALLDSSLGPP